MGKKLRKVIDQLRSEESRWDAILQLKILNGDGLTKALIPLMDDPDWVVRWCVAEKLGDIGDAQAVKPLVKALTDPDSHVQKNALNGLKKYGPTVIPLVVPLYAHPEVSVRRLVYELVLSSQERGINYLEKSIHGQNWVVANRIVDAIWRIGGERAELALIRCLSIPDAQKNSIVLLGAMYSKRCIEPLSRFYRYPNLRRLIVMVYERIGYKYVVPVLLKGKAEKGPARLVYARAILVKIGKPIMPYLIKALYRHKVPYRVVLNVIERIDIKGAMPYIHDLAEKSPAFKKVSEVLRQTFPRDEETHTAGLFG